MILEPTAIGLTLASGAVVGLLLAVFGGGGSVLAAPLLIYLVGVPDPHVAIGTSAFAVAVNAAASLIGQARAHRVKWPCASVFAAVGIAGSLAGAALARMVDGQQLLLFFALAMAAIALSMLRTPKSDGDPDVTLTWPLMARLAPVGAVTGLAAGFFGIGGGFLVVPGLMLATGMTLAHAAGSSLVSVSVFGLSTGLSYASAGMVDWRIAGFLIAGGLAGGLAGLQISRFLAGRAAVARKVFAIFILLAAAYVGWRAASAVGLLA